MRKTFADILAMIVFSVVVGMFIEICISHMTLAESIKARTVAIPFNIFCGRPQAVFRDWVQRRIGKSTLLKTIGDICAFSVFQTSLYAIILFCSGVSTHKITLACLTLASASLFIGRPYGWFLEWVRTLCKVSIKKAKS